MVRKKRSRHFRSGYLEGYVEGKHMAKPIEEMGEDELVELTERIRARQDQLRRQETLTALKTTYKALLRRYAVIIFEDADDEGSWRLALSSINKGYIDDRMPESEEEQEGIYLLLELIPHQGETNTCTYEILESDLDQCRNLLGELGIPEIEADW
jgi:hypothetical protein